MDDFEKEFEIIVNAQKKSCKEKIDYSQIVALAFPSSHGPDGIFTVQYSCGPKDDSQGTLVDGQNVKVTEGMVFDITRTDKS